MGIPSFYRHLVKTNPSLIRQKNDVKPAVLALDLNCAIYHCLSKLQKKRPYEPASKADFEDALIKMTIQYIVKLRDHVQPTNVLYVAVDGVVPMAKIRQQRMRRFKSVWLAAEENKIKGSGATVGWDRNAITPGTEFMDKLTKRLEDWGRVQLGLETIISGVHETGEGEQKIMSYLRKVFPASSGGEIIVYGLDADLIVLCLWHLREYGWSFKLLREEVEMTGGVKVNDKGEETLLYFDINQLAIVLKDRWTGVDLRDYVGAMSFLGNDFVPHGLTLCIREDGIDRVLEILQRVGRPLVVFVDGCWVYDKDVLMAVVKEIAAKESKWVLEGLGKKLKMSSRGYPPRPGQAEPSEVEKAMNALNLLPLTWKVEHALAGRSEEKGWYLLDGWSSAYYEKFLWSAPVERAVEEWLKAVHWILDYYTGSKPVDMLWYYPWYLPPLFTDVLKYGLTAATATAAAATVTARCVQNIINPIIPIAQLIMVLPVESYALLPTGKRGLPFKRPEYYPKQWTFFSAGRRMLWECEPMIPMLPYSVIAKFCDVYN